MTSSSTSSDLPEPDVSPDVYDEEYYLNSCAGAHEWVQSDGARMNGIYPATLKRAGLRDGETVVDIGTGRGELLAAAIRFGAGRAVGVEYSPAAVKLARRTLEAHGTGPAAEVVLADARRVPLPDDGADIVTMLDVVEHLSPAELDAALAEVRRLLRPGGRFIAHTFPTRTVYDVTYRFQRSLRRSRRRTWPADPRNPTEKQMHVNEQTLRSLRHSLRRAGFSDVRTTLGDWKWFDFVPDERARRTWRLLAAFPPTRVLAVSDMWGEARCPA